MPFTVSPTNNIMKNPAEKPRMKLITADPISPI